MWPTSSPAAMRTVGANEPGTGMAALPHEKNDGTSCGAVGCQDCGAPCSLIAKTIGDSPSSEMPCLGKANSKFVRMCALIHSEASKASRPVARVHRALRKTRDAGKVALIVL